MTLNEAVAARINGLLKERGLTQSEFEKKSGISHERMQRLLLYKNKHISFRTARDLACGFNISMAEFFRDPLFDAENLK